MPEESSQPTICEVCQKAEATVHHSGFCVNVGEDGGTQSGPTITHEYCDDCAQKLGFETATSIEACYYCGGQSAGGSPNTGPAFAVRGTKWHWTCRRCGQIERRYLMREFRKIQPHQSEEEAASMLENLYREADSHVREILKSGQEDTPPPPPPIIGVLVVPERISVDDLASLLGQKPYQIRMRLMETDVFPMPDEKLGFDVVSKLLREYGYKAEKRSEHT